MNTGCLTGGLMSNLGEMKSLPNSSFQNCAQEIDWKDSSIIRCPQMVNESKEAWNP